jgi:hypothetical protein
MAVTSLIWIVTLAWLLSRQVRRRQIGGGRSGARRSVPDVLTIQTRVLCHRPRGTVTALRAGRAGMAADDFSTPLPS